MWQKKNSIIFERHIYNNLKEVVKPAQKKLSQLYKDKI